MVRKKPQGRTAFTHQGEQPVEKTLEKLVGELLKSRGWRLAVAESCTGGLISHRLTNIPGSSDYFCGGIVAYANEVKAGLLGVSWETLEKHGAVSQATALEMARGVRKVMAVEIGLSVTGIAGPGGATVDKPVGLTWIGLSSADQEKALRFIWCGDRIGNKEQSAQAALQILVDFLQSAAR